MGAKIRTNSPVEHEAQLEPYDIRMLDTGPRPVAKLAGEGLPAALARKLAVFRYGPGVCKVDYALSEPVPWCAAPARQAGTLHLGGTDREISAAIDQVWSGKPAAAPYVLVAQPSVADASRAPAGNHSLWAYCHVPPGWHGDASPAIERQIERFAPGFRTRSWHVGSRGPASGRPTTPTGSVGTSTAACRTWSSCGVGRPVGWIPTVSGLRTCTCARLPHPPAVVFTVFVVGMPHGPRSAATAVWTSPLRICGWLARTPVLEICCPGRHGNWTCL